MDHHLVRGINLFQVQVHRGHEGFHFIHAAFVASAFEFGMEKDFHQLLGFRPRGEVGAQGEDVGVVALAEALGGEGVVAHAGPDALNLVGDHRHTETGAADEDA